MSRSLTVRRLFALPGVAVLVLAVAVGGKTLLTDSRHFDGVADAVYRFSPVPAKVEDLARSHGTDERMSIANCVELIQFYHQLISANQAL